MNGYIRINRSIYLLELKHQPIAFWRYLHYLACGERRRTDPHYHSSLLPSCQSIHVLKQIHAQIIALGYTHYPVLATKLVTRYVELAGDGGVRYARHVFERVNDRDVFLWNVMIRAYASLGPQGEAFQLYDRMLCLAVRPNRHTFTFVLKACAAAGDGSCVGRVVHCRVIKSGLDGDVFVANALVPVYAKCGEIALARKVFDEIPVKDIVSWNSILAGYAVNDLLVEALALLHLLVEDGAGVKPDRCTFVTLLPVCSKLSAVHEGFWIHSQIIKSRMELDAALCSGLIMLYASIGRLGVARAVFDLLPKPQRNVVVWNSMIGGYGIHGQATRSMETFSEMLSAGVHPDGACLTCVLSACAHAGLVDKGRELFGAIAAQGVEPDDVHYACMVDLLGRAGQLREAVEFVKGMPVKPGKDVWGALLAAARVHGDVELVEEAAERLFALDAGNAGRYAALAKVYEDAGRMADAARVRVAMRERGVKKPLGWSAVEVGSVFHKFGMGDDSHPMVALVYETVEELGRLVEEFKQDTL